MSPGSPGRSYAPPRRVGGLEVSEVADGLVVYEIEPERVHYLNNTAAVVFELCTGENDDQAIAGLMASAFELPEPPIEDVNACLAQLRDRGLVQ